MHPGETDSISVADMPKVSVIIPNYNHARFLESRMESVLAQTYVDLEIICMDDASTDNSLEILENYRNLKNVSIVRNDRNSGSPFLQWNRGIALARGEYIWIAESDDLADPRLLATLAGCLDDNPEVGLAYCQSSYIDEDDRVTGLHLEELEKQDRELWLNDFVMNGREMLASHMAVINVVPNASAVLFRKAVYEKCGGADGRMKLCGDWMNWAKMLLVSDLAFIARPFNSFRIHNTTVRSRVHKRLRYVLEYIDVLKFIFSNVAVFKTTKKRAAYQLKARWLRLAVEGSREISMEGMRTVFRSTHRLFGVFEAFQFLFIGCLSLASFLPWFHLLFKPAIRKARRIVLREPSLSLFGYRGF
jgi:glycosyltransferase involved in cell wall biosynthesis